MKKLNACADKGFAAVQRKLIAGEEIKCEACQDLLKQHKFNQDDLQATIEGVLSGEVPIVKVTQQDAESKPVEVDQVVPEKSESDVVSGKKVKKKSKKNQAGSLADPNGEEACFAFLKQFEPWIELLPPGTDGKKLPYRCKACKNKQQPEGRVGDLGRMKLWSVRHFLVQHVGSQYHKDNVADMEKLQVEVDKAPCEGLCVDDPETGGKLYAHRDAFHLWASMACFESSARHSYWREANSDSWFVRAKDCEKEGEVLPQSERTVCKTCAALTGAHSVPCLVISNLTMVQKVFHSQCCYKMSTPFECIGWVLVFPLLVLP